MSVEVDQATKNQTLASVLAFEIMAKRKQALQDRIDQRENPNPPPRAYSYLSGIEECDRMMAYNIMNPEAKVKIDTDLKARFEVGDMQEAQVNIELRQLGYDVILQQDTIEIKGRDGEVIGRGKIDGIIKYNKISVCFEVKSMHPMVFDNIDDLSDFQKKPYLRKYLRQLQMYLFGKNMEEGLLMCTNCLGAWKIFVVTLDYGESEQIVQKLERVHAAVKAKQLPERIEYRDEICGKCAFAHICLPDILRKELNVLTDTDLIFYLNEREMAKSAKSMFESADGWVKKFLKKYNIEKGLAGDFAIMGKMMPPKKPSEKEPQPYMMYSIKKVSEIEKPIAETI